MLGLKQLHRDFKRMQPALSRGVDRELRKAANIVLDETRKIARDRDPSFSRTNVSGYRARVRGFGRAWVEQSRGKTTAKRGDFGDIQMKRALLPALREKSDEVVELIDRMLDRLGNDYGFPEYAPFSGYDG